MLQDMKYLTHSKNQLLKPDEVRKYRHAKDGTVETTSSEEMLKDFGINFLEHQVNYIHLTLVHSYQFYITVNFMFQAQKAKKRGVILVFLHNESMMYFFKDICDLIREGKKVLRKEWFKSIVGVMVLEDTIRFNYVTNCRAPFRYNCFLVPELT